MNINTSAMFYQDFIGNYCVHFNLQRGTVVVSSLVNSLVSSLVNSLVSSSVGSSVSSLVSSLDGSSSNSLLGSSGLGYRYSLHVSPLILSNLNGLVHLPLCLVLPSRHTSTSELRGRLWIMVTDRPFRWFSASSTCFFALILVISSIAFFIAAARYVIEGASRSSLLI